MTDLAPHPWNTTFTWPDHTGAPRTLTREQVRAFDRDGFFVMERFVDAETVAMLDAAIEPMDREVVDFLATRPGGRFSIAGLDTVSIVLHPAARDATCRALATGHRAAAVAADLLGPEVRLYWDQVVTKRPRGSEPVLWHQDNGYTYVEPQAYLTIWVALTDATPDNGCVQVLPGVHRRGTLAHRDTPIGFECCEDPDGARSVPVRAGDAVVFSSLTPHATGRNTTDSIRRAYILQYAPDGAECLRGDPAGGPPVGRERQDAPDRQFPVVVAGAPVAPA